MESGIHSLLSGKTLRIWTFFRRGLASVSLPVDSCRSRTPSILTVLCAAIVFSTLSYPVSGQDRDKRRLEIAGFSGWASFPDDGSWGSHFVAGTSPRLYVSRRWSFAPEFIFMQGPGDDRDILLVPNLAFDFTSSQRIRPYLVFGAGVLFHHTRWFTPGGQEGQWLAGWTFGGGMGVKFFLSDRVFLAPEARLGWEPFLRSTVTLGYRF
jgi:hypothetical protein